MASGQLNGGGGTGGSYLRLEWQSYPNTGGNYSDVYVQLYLELRGGTSLSATEAGDINIDGSASGFSRGTTNRGPNGSHQVHTYSRTIGHNGDGTKQIQLGGYFDSGWAGFPNISVGMSTVTLDNIPRYATIPSFTLTPVTDERIQLNWTSSDAVDYVSWWSPQIDGGAHHDVASSGTGTFVIDRRNLASGTQYTFYVAVRRASSGLWTESGPVSATTLSQNNFSDVFEDS